MTVQEKIETILSKIVKKNIVIKGCGRTDAGVHSSQYFFHTELDDSYDFDLLERLNYALPADIAVFEIIPVEERAHTRFDATARTYDYFGHIEKDPFLYGYSGYYPVKNLDFALMKSATNLLLEYDDYFAFCKSPASFENTICKVVYSDLWVNKEENRFRFRITANRFLTGMIRIIMARILDVGLHKLSLKDFEKRLIEKESDEALTSAHPQGLYLSKIEYPYLTIPPRDNFILLFGNEGEDYWQKIGG
jgi:tRNA pseudouridine38-40 synthase